MHRNFFVMFLSFNVAQCMAMDDCNMQILVGFKQQIDKIINQHAQEVQNEVNKSLEAFKQELREFESKKNAEQRSKKNKFKKSKLGATKKITKKKSQNTQINIIEGIWEDELVRRANEIDKQIQELKKLPKNKVNKKKIKELEEARDSNLRWSTIVC